MTKNSVWSVFFCPISETILDLLLQRKTTINQLKSNKNFFKMFLIYYLFWSRPIKTVVSSSKMRKCGWSYGPSHTTIDLKSTKFDFCWSVRKLCREPVQLVALNILVYPNISNTRPIQIWRDKCPTNDHRQSVYEILEKPGLKLYRNAQNTTKKFGNTIFVRWKTRMRGIFMKVPHKIDICKSFSNI
jgi:hypothetical protein